MDWGKVEKAHDYKQPAPIVLMHSEQQMDQLKGQIHLPDPV